MAMTLSVPTAAYTGTPENAETATGFMQEVVADPAAMSAALNLVAEAPVSARRVWQFTEGPPDRVTARARALGSALEFLDLGPDSGAFRFDRPTETNFSRDPLLKQLLARHRATEHNPERHQEVTQQIRAKRLAIFAGRLAATTARPNTEQTTRAA